ncbi:MAG: SMC family ATPase [Anaerolineales bacterium]|nr:SMC family ATPase [Anaerolineales bacterium]MDW8162019.1 SMC family ATPase [Anaerolineales bacterium]
MIPLLLSLRGFLSYYQPVEIDFTSIDIACISGANGAGKSSIFDAMTWALFGVARKSDDTIIHSHPEVKAAEVELIFEYENNLYRVQRIRPRNAPTRLEFQVALPETVPDLLDRETLSRVRWRSLTERTLRDTQVQIHHLLRLDYETFTNASFFLQGKADQFTTQTPANRKKILSSILGLEVWEEYKARAIERRKRIEAQIEFIDGALAEIKQELSEEPARRLRLKEIETKLAEIQEQRRAQAERVVTYRQQIAVLEEQKRGLEELRKRVEAFETDFQEVTQKLQDRQRELAVYQELLGRASQIEEGYRRYQSLQSQLQALERAFVILTDLEQKLQSLRAELNAERARLAQEVLHLEQSQKRAELAQQNLLAFQREIAAVQEKLKEKEEELALCLQAEQKLQLLQEQIHERKGQNKHWMEEMKKLRSRIDALQQQTGEAACPLCGQPLSPEDRQSLIQSLEGEGKALKEQYLAVQAQIAQWEEELAALRKQTQLRTRIEQSLRRLEGEKEKWAAKLSAEEEIQREWQQDGAGRLERLRTQLQDEAFLPHLRQKMAQIEAQIQALGYERETHAKLRQAESELRPVIEEYQTLLQARAIVAPLSREVQDLERQMQSLRKQQEDLLQAWHSARSLLEQAERQAPDLPAAERELKLLEEEEREWNRQLGVARQLVDVLEDLKKRARNLEQERSEKAALVSRYKILERAFGKDGVPALIIEQALPQIEERANQILYRLSDGKMSLRFSTQVPYKDARRQDLRETLEIQISDASGIRDYELFSGGEAFRINFALRLAISELLARRAGARLQTLVIDEGFGSQDAQGRQYLIEAIHQVRSQFAKILIITHLDELKEAFPTRLEVEKTPQGSVVRIV